MANSPRLSTRQPPRLPDPLAAGRVPHAHESLAAQYDALFRFLIEELESYRRKVDELEDRLEAHTPPL